MTLTEQSPAHSPSGADRLCDTLLAHGVDVCFANPGTSEMHFVAALDRRPEMRCVLGLFEGVVTGAADGYGRMRDRPAATLLHLGPGLANGLANLHNARRASTPIINIIGDHARHHLAYDAPLASDIDSLAKTVSHWYGRIGSPDQVSETVSAAYRAALSGPGIASITLPADVAWSRAEAEPQIAGSEPALPVPIKDVEATAEMLRKARRPVLLAGGQALREARLSALARIADQTGARLIAENTNARMERGRKRIPIRKVPYRIDAALEMFAGTDLLVLVGAKRPVAFFAYPDKPSHPLPEGCEVVQFAERGDRIAEAVEALGDALGVDGRIIESDIPAPEASSFGASLTGETASRLIASMLPENAIVCDESLTGGGAFYEHSIGAAQHDYLELTGGAIGIGLPMAIGAAVACPDRKVVSLQADGSGMYTVQALWTQARERLNVTTVVFSNRQYAVLHAEMRNVGIQSPGHNARRMLNIDDPALGWAELARGMGVEAMTAKDIGELKKGLSYGFSSSGPFLIEVLV